VEWTDRNQTSPVASSEFLQPFKNLSHQSRQGAFMLLGLSKSEHEIVALVSRGLRNKEVAWQLGISENTVKFHLKNIYRKLNIVRRKDLYLLEQADDSLSIDQKSIL
jgi:DNA-binding CsgD family transcriptional regulator